LEQIIMRKAAFVQIIGLAMIARAQTTAPQATSALPDVVGIRPGISAQEAYNLLKARAPRARIGVGQFPVAGVTDKPVPVSLAINICDQAGRVVAILNKPQNAPLTNVLFAGPDLQTLYVTSGDKVYRRHIRRKGVLPWVPVMPPRPRL
jgi:hypothetical protein